MKSSFEGVRGGGTEAQIWYDGLHEYEANPPYFNKFLKIIYLTKSKKELLNWKETHEGPNTLCFVAEIAQHLRVQGRRGGLDT